MKEVTDSLENNIQKPRTDEIFLELQLQIKNQKINTTFQEVFHKNTS